jgi:hypothetical protein
VPCRNRECVIEVGSYNGWENKFTWLVHLHLSNEQALMLEILALVTRESDDRAAGWLIEMWVKGALFNCLTGVAGCASLYDGFMRLLAWDLAGSALAYADWDGLVALLTGRAQASENLFTLRSIALS